MTNDPTVLRFIIDALRQRTMSPDPTQGDPRFQQPAPDPRSLLPADGGGMVGGAGRDIVNRPQRLNELIQQSGG